MEGLADGKDIFQQKVTLLVDERPHQRQSLRQLLKVNALLVGRLQSAQQRRNQMQLFSSTFQSLQLVHCVGQQLTTKQTDRLVALVAAKDGPIAENRTRTARALQC